VSIVAAQAAQQDNWPQAVELIAFLLVVALVFWLMCRD